MGLLRPVNMRYILVMQNLSNANLSKPQRQFIDELAMLLVPWGMPITAARLYGYLHLQDGPVSLDEISAALEVSKSNACAAAKVLETHGNAKRQSERGSKRVLYVIGDDPGTTLRRQTELLGMMSDLIAERKDEVAEGAARKRLARLSAFHRDLRNAMLGAIQVFRENQRG